METIMSGMTLSALLLLGSCSVCSAAAAAGLAADEQFAATTPPPRMVRIPAGELQMGSSVAEMAALAELGHEVPHMGQNFRYWFRKEQPRHLVWVERFYIDPHEVSNSEFAAFVAMTGYEAEGEWRQYAGEGRQQHPVVNVSWNDARAYAAWRGARLPSEAEWEWAAQGGIASDYRWFPWGDEPDHYTLANYGHDRSFWGGVKGLVGVNRIHTRSVGCYAANGYGLYDMLGNAAEWCADDLLPYPGASADAPPFDRAEYMQSPWRVHRGGSWRSPDAVFIRCNHRGGAPAEHADWSIGFRCAWSPPEEAEPTAQAPARLP
jgi:formylglycine-generating enzyme required for sulfatase activity